MPSQSIGAQGRRVEIEHNLFIDNILQVNPVKAADLADASGWYTAAEIQVQLASGQVTERGEQGMIPIVHIISESDWRAAQAAGVWAPPSLASEGFIHCSRPEQVVATANRHYPGRTDLLLLVLDPARVQCEIRHEDTTGRGETYPHIYGPLNLTAIVEAISMPFDPLNGGFVLPSIALGAFDGSTRISSGVPDWARHRVLDRLSPSTVFLLGFTLMVFATTFSLITFSNSAVYGNALLAAMGMMIVADACLIQASFRSQGVLRSIAFGCMIPSLFVLYEFASRFHWTLER